MRGMRVTVADRAPRIVAPASANRTRERCGTVAYPVAGCPGYYVVNLDGGGQIVASDSMMRKIDRDGAAA